jgi:hypothetical protein
MNEAALEALIAKREIEDVILRYCRGIDRMDRDLVRSCYHADATDEHGSFSGGVDAYVEWAFALIAKYRSSMHFIGNVLIELHGGAAVAESYGIAYHRSTDPAPQRNLVTGFRFVDRFESRDGGPWRIAKRVAITEWSRIDERSAWWEIPEHLRQGQRDRGDALYQLLAELGTPPAPPD